MSKTHYAILCAFIALLSPMSMGAKADNNEATDWTSSLPIAPGSSMTEAALPNQQIHFQSVKDVRETNEYAWVAGQSAEGVGLEVTIFKNNKIQWAMDNVKEIPLSECINQLRSNQSTIVEGKGLAKSIKYNNRNLFVYKIEELSACKAAAITENASSAPPPRLKINKQ